MKSKFKTIVVKIGSSSLTDKQGKLDTANLIRIAGELSSLRKEGKNIVLVTSGAIVSGSERLQIKGKPKTIPAKQAAAAIGQSLLMKEYIKAFSEDGITVAQILLTRDEIHNREKYINAWNTLSELFKIGAIPIVNENDTVAIDEIKIGDNDNLAALVANLSGADILVLLTDVDGFMMKDADGELIVQHEIKEVTKDVELAAGHPSTQAGTGGMITKIQAANICSHSGIVMAIGNGRKKNVIADILNGKKVGTVFDARV
ncbi:glutamate 5-kinase, partial [Candidatus Margulisiibacteriota bacterium]